MAIKPKKKLPMLAGKPLDTNVLSREIAGPSLVSVRNIFSEQLTRSLTPAAAASYILEAQQGFPWNWLDICNGMERKWPHWRAVTETRKRAVIGLERVVTAASEDPRHIAHADFIRKWVMQDKFTDFCYDLLDATNKGFAVCEFVFKTDRRDGTWQPEIIAWRDPRWFAIDPNDGESLLIRDNSGYYPIANIPFKFCVHRAKTASGIMIDGGLCMAVIKNFVMTQIVEKFWPAFLELYGMPLRVGKLKQGAQVADKEALMAALTGLGSDAAAIITEWCDIEFKDAAGKGASSDVYKIFLEYQNDQASIVALGQTFTMGGSGASGGSGLSHSGKSQDNVRMDILEGDVKQLCGTINDAPVKWMIDLNFGEQADGLYPSIDFQIKETEDMQQKAAMLSVLTGPNVKAQLPARWLRGLVGAPDPKPGEMLSDGTVYQEPTANPAVSAEPGKPSTSISPVPVLPTPPEPIPTTGEVAPVDKVVNPALTGYIPEGEIVVPPFTPPQPWNTIPVMPYAANRIVPKERSKEMIERLKEMAKKYKSEDYKARTMARMDKAIEETETVSALLAKELRKKK